MKHRHVIVWKRQSNPSMIHKIWHFAVNRRRDYWRVTFVWAGFNGANLGLASTVRNLFLGWPRARRQNSNHIPFRTTLALPISYGRQWEPPTGLWGYVRVIESWVRTKRKEPLDDKESSDLMVLPSRQTKPSTLLHTSSKGALRGKS